MKMVEILEPFLLLDDFPVLLLLQQKIICSGQKYPPISIVQNFIAKGIRSPDPCQARWMVCRAHYQVGIVQYTQQCRLAHQTAIQGMQQAIQYGRTPMQVIALRHHWKLNKKCQAFFVLIIVLLVHIHYKNHSNDV